MTETSWLALVHAVPARLKLFEERRRDLSIGRSCGTDGWKRGLDRKTAPEDLELNRIPGGQTTMTTETMWRCDQVRAGQLYNRMMFDTREEAEQFMNRMRQMEPDQMISIEAIEAWKVWN
jgi:hypothetical protein